MFVVDRKKDLIIRGGFNVYPREVEELLYHHPAVAEAAVIGEPDARPGEEIVAVVSLKPGVLAEPEQIVAWAKDRIAAYKYPRRVRIVAELPKGPDREDHEDSAPKWTELLTVRRVLKMWLRATGK